MDAEEVLLETYFERVEQYVRGRWEANVPPRVLQCSRSCRLTVNEVALAAQCSPQLIAGWASSDLATSPVWGKAILFPAIAPDTSDFARQTMENFIDSYAVRLLDGQPLTMARLAVVDEVAPSLQALQAAEMTETAGTSAEVVEQPAAGLETVEEAVDARSAYERAMEYYSCIPNFDEVWISRRHPFHLPAEAYSSWKISELAKDIPQEDVLVPNSTVWAWLRAAHIPFHRIRVLSGDESGQVPPTEATWQIFRSGGRRFMTSSVGSNLRKAAYNSYKRKTWHKKQRKSRQSGVTAEMGGETA